MGGALSRRELLKAGGALVVSLALDPLAPRAGAAAAPDADRLLGKPLASDAVDAFLSVNADGTVTVFSGNVALGTGARIAWRQIAAEERAVPAAGGGPFLWQSAPGRARPRQGPGPPSLRARPAAAGDAPRGGRPAPGRARHARDRGRGVDRVDPRRARGADRELPGRRRRVGVERGPRGAPAQGHVVDHADAPRAGGALRRAATRALRARGDHGQPGGRRRGVRPRAARARRDVRVADADARLDGAVVRGRRREAGSRDHLDRVPGDAPVPGRVRAHPGAAARPGAPALSRPPGLLRDDRPRRRRVRRRAALQDPRPPRPRAVEPGGLARLGPEGPAAAPRYPRRARRAGRGGRVADGCVAAARHGGPSPHPPAGPPRRWHRAAPPAVGRALFA